MENIFGFRYDPLIILLILGKNFDVKSSEQGLISQKIVFNLDTRTKFIHDIPKIDLHGLYVKNAIHLLSKLLVYYKGKCSQGEPLAIDCLDF